MKAYILKITYIHLTQLQTTNQLAPTVFDQMVALNSIFKKTRVDLNIKHLFCGFFWMLKSVKHKFFSNFKFSKNKSHSANKIKQIFRELIFTTDFYSCNEMKQSLYKTSTMHQKSFSCQHKKETTFLIVKNQEGKLSK